jgi:hypothetical protein
LLLVEAMGRREGIESFHVKREDARRPRRFT